MIIIQGVESFRHRSFDSLRDQCDNKFDLATQMQTHNMVNCHKDPLQLPNRVLKMAFLDCTFSMIPHMACFWWCKVTMVALVWLFPNVRVEMLFQIVCLRGYKFTMVACVWLSPMCIFKCALKLPVWEDAKSHWLHLIDFLSLCIFKCVLNIYVPKNTLSRWLHLFGFSLLCVFKLLLKLPAYKDAKLHKQDHCGEKPRWIICDKWIIYKSGLIKHLPRHCGESSH